MDQFELIKKNKSGVRIGKLHTPHGVIHTPFFMPVATVGSVKSVAPWELRDLGAEIILSNTYHLYLRPGEQLIKELGGLHRFMGWDGPILTDSGGYQVFSLGLNSQKWTTNLPAGRHGNTNNEQRKNDSLVTITDDGVEFKSHLDGSKHFFTPEKVIQIQLDLGVDILMPLDVCPSGKASREEAKRAVDLTIRWAERAKRFFELRIQEWTTNNTNNQRRTQNLRPMLHGIVQGGLDEDLRKECAKKLMDMDFDGYSIGGLAVDLETRDMWNIVKLMGEILPEDKQRYLMGVGTPDDIIKATQLGMDMFDCVLPTRMARHGSVYTQKWTTNNTNNEQQELPRPLGEGGGALRQAQGTVSLSNSEGNDRYTLINLLNSEYRTNPRPIEENCGCPACNSDSPLLFKEGRRGGYVNNNGFSRAYISHLLRSKEILGVRLATLHNLFKYLELMDELKRQ